MTSTNIKLFIGVLLFLSWIGLVVAKVYIPAIASDQLVGAIQSALVGLGVYHMSDGKGDTPSDQKYSYTKWPDSVVVRDKGVVVDNGAGTVVGTGAGGTQSGFARPMLLVIIAIAMLAGCAGLNVSWVATASYNTPATTSAVLTPGAAKPAVPDTPAAVQK